MVLQAVSLHPWLTAMALLRGRDAAGSQRGSISWWGGGDGGGSIAFGRGGEWLVHGAGSPGTKVLGAAGSPRPGKGQKQM